MSRRPNARTRTRFLRTRSLRTRLLVFVSATLVVVCVAMGLITTLFQRAYLMGNLDDRVRDAAERALGGASSHRDTDDDLAFLRESGQPAGMLSARLDEDGAIVSAAVVVQGTPTRELSTGQRTALAGIRADGALHTRAVPGLGTYRVTVLVSGDVRVLAGLPMDDVQDMISGLVMIETGVAVAALAAAGCVCAVVIRRQLRPLGRVAATAAEVSRAPLGRGEATALTRVPERDTDPGSEAGQVGAALNRLLDHVESSLAERQRGEERMRRSEERMRRFLADASHELRTPLASISGYAELMNRGTDRVEPVRAWRRVSAESARMTGLVEDLLLLARLDEGRPLQSGEVDLAALVAEAVWEARAAGSGHDWQLELSLDAPVLVTGEETRLHQVVANLLSNARMHTPAGTRVTASVESADGRCVIRVRDNGPGIPPTAPVTRATRELVASPDLVAHWRIPDADWPFVDTARDHLLLEATAPPGDGSTELPEILLSALIARLRPPSAEERPAHPVFRLFRSSVEAHFRDHHDAGYYARALGYAPRTLSRAVQQVTGRTAKAYIVDRLVLEAKRLLAHDRLTAAGCAHALGFPDASNFSVFFLKATGMRPGAWQAGAAVE